MKAILRTYGGIFENRMPINVSSLANKTGINEKDILEILKKLHSDKIIDLDQKKHDASITFLVPREDEAGIYPYSPYIKQQAKNKTDKISALLAYVNNEKTCRNNQLLHYFGEETHVNCGICSVCNPTEKNEKKELIKRIYLAILGALESGDKNSRELVTILPFAETAILKVLELLLEKDIIELTGTKKFTLTKYEKKT